MNLRTVCALLEGLLNLYTEKIADFKTSFSEFPRKMLSMDGLFVVGLTLVAIIFLLFSLKMRRLCIGIIIFAISYVNLGLILESTEYDTPKIYYSIRKMIPESIINYLTDNERGFYYCLFVSVLLAVTAIYLYKWVRFMILIYLVYICYDAYKIYLMDGKDPSSSAAMCCLILGITIIVYFVVRSVEEIFTGFVIGYIGSTLTFAFCDGAFGFPEEYYEMYAAETFKDFALNPYFGYTVILCVVCMILQKNVFNKKS